MRALASCLTVRALPRVPRALPPLARPLHSSCLALAKAQKGASGKKKGKETVGVPAGFNMDMLAKDWGAWEHGEKLDVTLPWKAGDEPAWLKAILATADSNGVLHWSPRKVKRIHELEPEVHGLRYTWQRLRKEKILRDNQARAWGKWKWVGSAKKRNAFQPPRMHP